MEGEIVMKKLLIIMLVLGIATAANAALSWEIRESDGTTVVADTTKLQLDDDYVLVLMAADGDEPKDGGIYPGDWSKITVSNPQVGANNGDLGTNAAYLSGYEWGIAESGAANTQTVTTGDMASWDFSADTEGTGSFDFYDYDVAWYTAVGSQTFTIVPEPITIALLGLGGLFLRRRK